MGKRIITALLVLLPIVLRAQSKTEQIRHIRHVFQTINRDSLKKVVIDSEGLSALNKRETAYDGGEELTGYYRRDTLVKIVYEVGLSYGMKAFEYYFENDKVVFISERQDNYPYDTKRAEFNYNTSATAFEGRYYLSLGKVIKTIKTGSLIGDKNETTSLMKNDIPKYSGWLLRLYKKHNKG